MTRSVTHRALPLFATVLLSAGLLTGCSLPFGGPAMIDTDDIADLAEEALEDEYDAKYRVDDCEDEEIEYAEGESVDCIATDRDADLSYEVAIEITDINGSKYEVEIDRDDEPIVDEDDEDTDSDTGTDTDTDGNGSGLYVTAEQLAKTATTALEGVLGYAPTDMECSTEEFDIYVDNYDYCFFTSESGDYEMVEVVVTEVDESTGEYRISAEVV